MIARPCQTGPPRALTACTSAGQPSASPTPSSPPATVSESQYARRYTRDIAITNEKTTVYVSQRARRPQRLTRSPTWWCFPQAPPATTDRRAAAAAEEPGSNRQGLVSRAGRSSRVDAHTARVPGRATTHRADRRRGASTGRQAADGMADRCDDGNRQGRNGLDPDRRGGRDDRAADGVSPVAAPVHVSGKHCHCRADR